MRNDTHLLILNMHVKTVDGRPLFLKGVTEDAPRRLVYTNISSVQILLDLILHIN